MAVEAVRAQGVADRIRDAGFVFDDQDTAAGLESLNGHLAELAAPQPAAKYIVGRHQRLPEPGL
jgi:hypothetical protein